MKQGDYQLGYRGDIEGLRALAILLVVGAHAGVPWLAGGFVGVDVFFVLSGFLITGLLLREMSESGGIALGDFYLRRLRRLMPALVLMVVVVSLLAAVVLAPGEQLQQPSAAAMAVLWASNIHFALAKLDYFAPGTDSNLFLHTWSLGVEEQFYLIWPLLLLAAAGNGVRRIGRLRAVMVGVVVAGLVVSCLLTPRFPQWAFYMMPVRAWEFAMGALIWLGMRGGTQGLSGSRVSALLVQWVGWIGLAMVLAPAFAYDNASPYPGWRAVIPALGATAMVWVGSHGGGIGVTRLLGMRPLQWLGRISYALYLWHWPVLLLATALAGSPAPSVRVFAVGIALLIAIASYRWVEYPMRHQAWWLKRRRMAWMGALGVMVFVNVLTMQWFDLASTRESDPAIQQYASARQDTPIIYAKGCDDYFRSSEVRPCIFGAADAGHTAVLMGDSIAGQWFPAVAKVFAGDSWRLIVLTKSSCPMVDESFVLARIGRQYTECQVWRRNALAQVAALHPDVVLLSTVATDSFSQAQWTDGTARVLDALVASSRRIVILRGTPRLPFDGPDCLASHAGRPAWLGRLQACQSPSADPHDEQVMAWLQQAISRYPNVRLVDMNDLVCPDGTCAAERDGRMIFRDSQHMTASFTASLAPALAQRVGGPDMESSSGRAAGL